MQETRVQSLGCEDPLKEMATHSSIPVWEIPWSEEPGGLQSMGSQKSWTWLSNLRTTTVFLDYMNFSISFSVGKNAQYFKPTILTGGKCIPFWDRGKLRNKSCKNDSNWRWFIIMLMFYNLSRLPKVSPFQYSTPVSWGHGWCQIVRLIVVLLLITHTNCFNTCLAARAQSILLSFHMVHADRGTL